MPAIQSIQRGTLVTTQNDASPNAVVTITPVITANAVVMFTSKDTDNTDRDQRHLYSAYLSSASQITFTRSSQSFATNVTIEWEVVEFAPGALQSLQTGSIGPTAAVTSVALGTPVNPAAAVPLVTEWTNSGTLLYVTPLPSITTTTTAGDTLKFTLPSAPAAGLYNCRWQLIEFKAADASVQSGTTTLGSTGGYSATQAIAPVDLTKTLVAAFHYGGSTSTDARQSMRYFPASSTSLQFDMQPSGSMSPATIQWYTVTLLDGSKVQSGGLSIAAGATVPTTQPTWSAMAHGSLWSPHQFANAYITGTVDSDPWDVHLAYHFNATQDGAAISRGGSVTPVSAYYQAVDWAASGSATNTGTGAGAVLAAAASSPSQAAAALSTSVALAATLASSSTSSASLSTAISLSALASSQSSAAAGLSTKVALIAASSSQSGANTALSTSVNLVAPAMTPSSAAAVLTVGGSIAAAVVSPSAAQAALATAINVLASATTPSVTSAALSTSALLAAAAVSKASASAVLTTAISLGASAATPSSASAALAAGAGTMAASTMSPTAASSALTTVVALAATVVSASSASADLRSGQRVSVLPNPKRTYLAQPRVREYIAQRRVRELSEGTMNFSPMRVGERDVFTANYTPLLRPGETISHAAWSATVVHGVDPSPMAMIQGDPAILGPKVSQMIVPVVPGITYRLICTVQTSFGRELILPDPGRDQLYVPS